MCSPCLDSVQDGATALIVATENGHLKVVESIIAAKVKINIRKKVRCIIKLLLSWKVYIYNI